MVKKMGNARRKPVRGKTNAENTNISMNKVGAKDIVFGAAGIFMVAVALVVIAVYLPGAISNKSSNTSMVNQSWGNAGSVSMYDGGINHTYFINKTLQPINITLNDTIMGPLTVYKGLIFASTAGPYEYQLLANYTRTHGSVAAISAYTGKLAWRTHFPNQVIDQPIAVGNYIYVTTGNNAEVPTVADLNNNNQIYALNIINGNIVWNETLPGPVMPTLAYKDGKLIAAGTGGISFFDAKNGNLLKQIDTGLPDTMSSPLVVGNNTYFGAGYADGYTRGPITGIFKFFDINATTGNVIWSIRFNTAGGGINDVVPTYYKGIVITGYLNHSEYTNPILVGLNSTTGSLAWVINENVTDNLVPIESPPITAQSYMYVTEPAMSAITLWHGIGYSDTNYEGNLYAFNATTGKVLWIFHTGQCESNPNIYNGTAVIVSDGGMLYVLNATDGALINETDIHMEHLSNEVIISKNEALFTNMNGTILSIPIKNLLQKNV
ncbi:MAG: PQQ-binding-like beta-propeller repeat protein [Candidatus Micrarchaeaceae archaeon]